jgi:hypothetical protein
MHLPMKKNWFKFLIIVLSLITLSSCLWDDEETELSSDPTFISLKFGRNDSIPALQYANFTLVYDSVLKDSIIVNLDSLPYQTRIDSVFPTFTFRSTYLAQIILIDSLGTGFDTIAITGKDTVDFTRVVKVRNIALSQKAERTYPVKVNVHQVEPELYVWKKLKDQIYTHPGSMQKAVYFKNEYLLFVGSGLFNYLYVSTDAANWSSAALSGMPAGLNFRNITEFNNSLFLADEAGDMLSSSDGRTWIRNAGLIPGHKLISILFALEGNLWTLVRNDISNQIHFAMSSNGLTWSVQDQIPAAFPIGDFASLSFKSRTNKPKALVLGGFDVDGKLLAKSWSVEKNVFGVYKWVDFSLENSTLVSLSGAMLVPYDKKLLLFGGADADDNVINTPFMESIDEGLSWRAVNETYNSILDQDGGFSYDPRSYQSVILDEADKRIYLFGGRTRSNVFSDVWTGKLNRMSFAIQ